MYNVTDTMTSVKRYTVLHRGMFVAKVLPPICTTFIFYLNLFKLTLQLSFLNVWAGFYTKKHINYHCATQQLTKHTLVLFHIIPTLVNILLLKYYKPFQTNVKLSINCPLNDPSQTLHLTTSNDSSHTLHFSTAIRNHFS